MFDLTRVLQTLTDALSLGSLYALIAIGYTMVYGVLRLINFAHGEIFMIAMYIVFFGKKQAGKDAPKMCHRINQRFLKPY